MRIRSVSLLATTLAALLGCPLENMQASPSDDQASSERDDGAGLAFDNSEAHDDPVDAREDVSWVDAGEMAQGSRVAANAFRRARITRAGVTETS